MNRQKPTCCCLPVLALYLAGAALTLLAALGQAQDEFGSGPLSSLNELEPEETLEVLTRMVKLSESNQYAGYSIASEQIRNLVNMSEVSASKCEPETFSVKPDAPIEFLRQFCLPYLNYYVREQLQLCLPTLQARIKTFLSHYPQERKRDIRLLVDRTSGDDHLTLSRAEQARVFRLSYPRENLVEGLLKFISEKEGGAKKLRKLVVRGEKGEEKFGLAYSKWVVTMCINLINGLRSSIGIYRTVFKFGLAELDPDELTAEWMINYEVCDQIITSKKSLTDEAYSALTKKFNQEPKSSWLSWFTCAHC